MTSTLTTQYLRCFMTRKDRLSEPRREKPQAASSNVPFNEDEGSEDDYDAPSIEHDVIERSLFPFGRPVMFFFGVPSLAKDGGQRSRFGFWRYSGASFWARAQDW